MHEVNGTATPAREFGHEYRVDLPSLSQGHNLLPFGAIQLHAGSGLFPYADDLIAGACCVSQQIALLPLAGAAEQRPEFAAELSAFVAEVRKLFTPQELRDHFAELERTPLFETEPEDEEEVEDDSLDNPAQEVEQRQRLAWVKAMLLQLGS